ncbi:protein of unknown function [Xenorhabdus doucetiae]|uniref:Uncharacterized protein n=1 Tax=Xenorhabdus doucetiae TaxID=351671 RepID=A0A068QQA7_9GAMM|nr:protein of unknown function [Xenorhabdus doucetiae]
MIGMTQSLLGIVLIWAINQIAKIGLSSLQVIYYFENLFRKELLFIWIKSKKQNVIFFNK